MVTENQRDSPYKGLMPYDEGDAPYFFGRERETRLIAASLFASSLTLLYGASGVGKSSVLRAGVVNLLKKRDDLLVLIFNQWQGDALNALKRAVARAAITLRDENGKNHLSDESVSAGVNAIEALALQRRATKKQQQQSSASPHLASSHVMLDEYLTACSVWLNDRRLMLILDQFEEYMLYHTENDAFGDELPRVVAVSDLSVSVLLSLREDALAKLDRFEGSVPALFSNYRRVDHLSGEAAREAILLPIEKYIEEQQPSGVPVAIEPALVDEVLKQVQTEQVIIGDTGRGTVVTRTDTPVKEGRIETPYLQLVMTRLWTEETDAGSPLLRLETLLRLGGAQEIVRTHLNAVMGRLTAEERDTAANVFNFLVTPSGSKIAYMVRDLEDLAIVSSDQLRSVLEKLSSGSDRILRPVSPLPEYPGELRYEIFHDRLGPAILDWRSRYIKEREIEETKRLEAERRRYTNTYIDRFMERLDDDEQAIAAQAISFLVTPSGTKTTQRAKDLAEYINVDIDQLQSVLEKLSTGEDALLRKFTLKAQPERPRFEIASDAFAFLLLDWRSRYIAAKERTRVEQEELARERAKQETVTHVEPTRGGGGGDSYRDQIRPQPPYSFIGEQLLRGKIVPFLGPDINLSARPAHEVWKSGADFPPTDVELARHLAEQISFPYDRYEESSNLTTVATYWEAYNGQVPLHHELHTIFSEHEFEPSGTHRYLAEIARRTRLFIITMNYDTLLERAFDEAGVPYDLIVISEIGDVGLNALHYPHGATEPNITLPHRLEVDPDKTVIYKIRGSINRQGPSKSSFIITEMDYIALLGNVLSDRAMPMQILRPLFQWASLYIGLNFTDWSQRTLVRSIFSRFDRTLKRASWAVVFKPSALEAIFWRALDVAIYDENPDDFVLKLREATNQS